MSNSLHELPQVHMLATTKQSQYLGHRHALFLTCMRAQRDYCFFFGRVVEKTTYARLTRAQDTDVNLGMRVKLL